MNSCNLNALLRRRCRLFVGMLLVPAACVAGWVYLKSPYEPRGATSVATMLLQEIYRENWQHAHDLTLKNGYTGRTLEEFRRFSNRQVCTSASMVYWGPPQSHGNRLRHWLGGTEPDQDRVWVEFHGLRANIPGSICMMSVEVRRIARNQWKVFNFQSHAG